MRSYMDDACSYTGEAPEWRLMADRTIVCGATGKLIFLHITGAVLFVGIVVLFPLGITQKVRKVARLHFWEDESELIKYSNFYADFRRVTKKDRYVRYFFCWQHLVMCTLLAVVEVFLGFNPQVRIDFGGSGVAFWGNSSTTVYAYSYQCHTS